MKVALVIEFFDPRCGGASQWTIGFAKFLLDKGHTVFVVSFRSANHALPVKSYVLPHSPYPLERSRRVSRCIEKIKPDVVYDAGTSYSGDVLHPHAGSLYLTYRLAVGTMPMMPRLRTAISPRGLFLRWSLQRLEKLQMARARCVVAVSQQVRMLLSKRHGLSDSHLVVVPNAVDNTRFAPERLAELRAGSRRALEVQHETVFLLLAQNLLLKGADTAIRALGHLIRENTAVRLVIAGAAPSPFLRRLVVQCGANGHVSFLEFATDVVPLYSAADALVHPTRSDACSLATLEAMAAGLPVVTTLMNGAAESICDGANGLLVRDPEDTSSLATQMRRLLDPHERRRIGAAARQTAAGYNLDDNFQRVERILLIVATQKHPHCAPGRQLTCESSS